MSKPDYVIVAGINGAGKSTLYQLQPELCLKTRRLNADEILQNFGGDWRNKSDTFKAMKMEVKSLHQALDKRQGVHIETTLAGNAKTQLRLIEKAHAADYQVTLIYVVLDSAEKAIERVRLRVQKGGHGIAPEVIRRRYVQSRQNFPAVAAQVDRLMVYDNSEKFRRLYVREGDRLVLNELKAAWKDLI